MTHFPTHVPTHVPTQVREPELEAAAGGGLHFPAGVAALLPHSQGALRPSHCGLPLSRAGRQNRYRLPSTGAPSKPDSKCSTPNSISDLQALPVTSTISNLGTVY
eukprot:3660853-Pyramimonas_sp.AAC.2